jgi:hypothetical protein
MCAEENIWISEGGSEKNLRKNLIMRAQICIPSKTLLG